MIPGDPVAVEAAAATLAGTRGFADAAAAVDAAAHEALSGWEGQAAAAAGEAFTRYGPALVAGDEACRALAPALHWYAAELRAAQEQEAQAQAFALQAVPAGTPAGGVEAVQVASEVARATDEAARSMDAAAERVRVADERAAAAILEAQGRLAAMIVPAPAGGPIRSPATEEPADEEPRALSTLGHTVLDVAGLVPVLGEIADVANAAWYGLEGDYVAAGLSLAAAIPIAGWLFTGGKLGMKGFHTIKAVSDTDGAAAWAKGRPSTVPWNARQQPYGGGQGEAYKWKDAATGKSVRYHAHAADPEAPAGSNSATGPTYRIRVGNHYIDANGTPYTDNQLKKTSNVYSAQAANDTHIPYPTNQPLGWDPGRRVFVPNGASLVDGTGDEGGSQR